MSKSFRLNVRFYEKKNRKANLKKLNIAMATSQELSVQHHQFGGPFTSAGW